MLSLYQVDVGTKHTRNEKHLNSTKRNIKRRIRAIYYWYNTRSCGRILSVLPPFSSSCIAFFTYFPCFIRSNPTDVNQETQTLESIPSQNLQKLKNSNYRSEMMPILEIFTLRCRRSRRQDTTEASRLPAQSTTFLLACLAERLYAFTSRGKTDKEDRGALEPPFEDGA